MDKNSKTTEIDPIEKVQKQLERKNKETEILKEISVKIRGALDLNFTLNTLLLLLDKHFAYKHSMILLSSPGSQFLTVFASYGYPDQGVGAKVEMGKGIIGMVAKKKQIIRLGNITIGLRYMSAGKEVTDHAENEIIIKLPGLANPISQVAIPLLLQEELAGVLSVESSKLNIFKAEDEDLISLLASQAAIAIQNARLFEAERKRYSEVQEVNRKLSELTKEQQKTLDLFVKYVPKPVVQKALSEKTESIFDGEQIEIAVLFCDIRNFTPISEGILPSEVVALLNSYYSNMNDVIKKFDGAVNQYVGDEIFVTFGAPVSITNCEEKSVLCAIGMIEQLEILNKELRETLGIEINVGIGINFGPVVAGNLGSEDKIEYSVTGDTVNTAKRIESLTKSIPNAILVSESIYEKTNHLIKTKAWEPVKVKGKNEHISVYQVLGLSKK